MRTLGVIIGHDSSACLVEGGKVVRYAAEERFNRIKVGLNCPHESVGYCLGEHKMGDMDYVAIGGGISRNNASKGYYEALFNYSKMWGIPPVLKPKCHDAKSVDEIDHHECHAASAYYTSGFDRALVVVLDGIGESTTHSVYEGVGKDLKLLYCRRIDSEYERGADGVINGTKFKELDARSVGWFYSAVTEALGWRMVCDEGKTMGLAPYGDPKVIPENLMRLKMYDVGRVGYYGTDGRCYYSLENSEYYRKLAEKYGRENLAASAQKILEDDVLEFISGWVKKTGINKVCAAGGVFLNVKVNQKVRKELGLEDYWAFPLANDTGISVGAALRVYWKHAERDYEPSRISHVYWGPEYSDDEIKRVLDLAKLDYKPYDVEYVAGKLARNKIVGWFQGRMEGGPRALGGRSILMSPLHSQNKDTINAQVKFREAFRPFCPSVTSEAADKYFDGGGKFMIEACNVKTDDIPAVRHIDGTARPQIVRRDDNAKFHELIDAFGRASGHPVLLNTSLNVMGEPICLTPRDALRCFYSVGLDLLVIGDYMIEKGLQ